MIRLAWAGFFIIVLAVLVILSPHFGDKAERLAIAALLISLYSMAVGFAQAFYAREQARFAGKQTRIAEAADLREQIATMSSADAEFRWQAPTGNAEGVNLHMQNAGGTVQITHAEVTSGGTDYPMLIPVEKVQPGQIVTFSFKPKNQEKIFPLRVLIQFQDFYGRRHQKTANGPGWGKVLMEEDQDF